MNRLIAFGCSNTYGEGLPDCWINNNAGPTPSMFAWPQLTADALNLECVNLSIPGNSNKKICYDILNTEFKQTDTVVVLWTYTSRTCLFCDDGSYKRILVQDATRKEFSSSRRRLASRYYRDFFTDTNSIIDFYMFLNLVEQFLSKQNIKNYHFTCDESLKKRLLKKNNTLIPKWNQVNLNFDANLCQYDRALDNLHPGLGSHQKMSENIKKHMLENGYNDI